MKYPNKLRKLAPLPAWLLLLVGFAGCARTSYIGGTFFEKATVTGTAIINNAPVELTLEVQNTFVVDEATMEQMLTQ